MSAVKVIRLPSGREMRLGAYVSMWRWLLTAAPCSHLGWWDGWGGASAEHVLREVRRAMHDRINLRGGIDMRLRGRDSDAALRRDARIVADATHRRIRYSGRNVLITRYMRRRYPEVNNPEASP